MGGTLLLLAWLCLSGAGQGVQTASQIPPNPPLLKGGITSPPFSKGGSGGILVEATITAYCLAGQKTTSGKVVYPGCLALSRGLARQLGLKSGPGPYDYRFGARIRIEGVGVFIFDDLMPPQWRRPRVDLHRPTVKQCRAFGVKKRRIWVEG